MAEVEASPLKGKGIVVTRPLEQAGEFVAALEARGAVPIVFPSIQIEPPESWQSLDQALRDLAGARWALFISRNAVTQALSRARSLGIPWPRPGPGVAAIGRETAKALRDFGIEPTLVPKVFNSETLLEAPELREVRESRVVLFAGDQGRELIEETLKARGAAVEKAYCYRRTRPAANPTPLMHAWARGRLHAVTVTSPEVFHNFYQMIGGLGQRWLKGTPVIAISPLTAAAVESAGLPKPWVAPEASTAGMIAALESWAAAPEIPL